MACMYEYESQTLADAVTRGATCTTIIVGLHMVDALPAPQ